MAQNAIGFILRPTSGDDVRRHEDAMEREATRLGFTWSATFFADAQREGNYVRLVNQLVRDDIDAVFLPSAGHLAGQDIEVLITHCDVYLVAEGQRHTILSEDGRGRKTAPRVEEYRAPSGEVLAAASASDDR